MKFTIPKEEFCDLINKIQNVVPIKPPTPLLFNFLLEAANDELVLTATDLSVTVRCHTRAARIEREGSITLPARRMAQLARELTAPEVTLSADSNCIVEMVAGSSRFKINGMAKQEFPDFPDLNGATTFSLKQKDLREALERVAFAVSRDDSRYVLMGVLMRIANGVIMLAGSDGKRLARTYLTAPQLDPSLSGDFIIRLKAVEEILSNLTKDDAEATVYLLPDRFAIEANRCFLAAKLLTGEYPDINRVIPKQVNTYISLHREELISLLRQVSLFMVDLTQSVRFSFETGELKLTANSMEIGEGHVSMPVNYRSETNEERLDIAFNPGFFLDILRHSKKETIALGLIDSYNPGVLLESEEPVPLIEANPLFVLMPMRLHE